MTGRKETRFLHNEIPQNTTASTRFMQACRRESVDCTPVWFMRQAGRYMPEYRRVRERHGLLEMFKTPEISAEITLQPVRALPIDAAIIFADILLPLEAMGLELDFVEGKGPVIQNPVRTLEAARALRTSETEERLDYVMSSLRLVRSELSGKIPLIGFGGAPFTLASYMVEGGASRDQLRTKKLMYGAPELWHEIMRTLSKVLIQYLTSQVRAGAEVIQLFDSWVGCLGPSDYHEYVLPYSKAIFDGLEGEGIPTIHFGTGTGDLLPLMREAGGTVVGVDWRTPLDQAWARLGSEVGIQGNLDPITLMAPWPVLKARAAEVLDRADGKAGHIFNLGHGILPQTPVDAVKALADFVHEHTS